MQKLRSRRELGVLPSFSWRSWLQKLPFLVALRGYEREFFASDLAAGLAEVRKDGMFKIVFFSP